MRADPTRPVTGPTCAGRMLVAPRLDGLGLGRLQPAAFCPIAVVATVLLTHGLACIHGLPPIVVALLGAKVQIAVGTVGSLLWQLSRRGPHRVVVSLPPRALDRLGVSLLAPRRSPASSAPARHTACSRRGPPARIRRPDVLLST